MFLAKHVLAARARQQKHIFSNTTFFPGKMRLRPRMAKQKLFQIRLPSSRTIHLQDIYIYIYIYILIHTTRVDSMAYAKYVRVVVIVEYISSFMSNNITRVYYYYVFLLCILHIMTSC